MTTTGTEKRTRHDWAVIAITALAVGIIGVVVVIAGYLAQSIGLLGVGDLITGIAVLIGIVSAVVYFIRRA